MPLYLLCINAKGAEGSGIYCLREGKVYTFAGWDVCGGCGWKGVLLLEQPVNGRFAITRCNICKHIDRAPPYWSWAPRRFIEINDPDLWNDLTKESLEECILAFMESH